MPPLPSPVGIQSFTLTFFSDRSGQPGSQIGSPETVSFANAHETLLGTRPGASGANMLASYSATLPTPFTAQANTPYWMSIVANFPFSDDTTNTAWGWQTGVPPTDPSLVGSFQQAQFPNAPGTLQPLARTQDLSFSLLSPAANVIPEPSSLALLGLGVAALAGWYRRGKKRGGA
jgi:hypothetical protein